MKKYRRIVPAALALALLCTGAALAANGDKSDPLVTLSFLALPVIPDIRLTDEGLFDVTTMSFIK